MFVSIVAALQRRASLFVVLCLLVPLVLSPPVGAQPFPIDPSPIPDRCVRPPSPLPSGVTEKPMEGFPAIDGPVDHLFLHSSTHLQGRLAQEKWSGGLVYEPTGTAFDEYTSAIVVNNPNQVGDCVVDIDYFDADGTIIQTTAGLVIGPEQLRVDVPTDLSSSMGSTGVGTARISVTNGCDGIVGSTLTHTYSVLGITDPDEVEPFLPNVGAGSQQQLQKVQSNKTELWWGPMPVTHSSTIDFFNGNTPTFWVVNPNDEPNTIQIDLTIYDQATGTVVSTTPWRNVTLPPFGTLFEADGAHLGAVGTTAPGLWDDIWAMYTPPPGVDWDLSVHISSENGLPLLGDGLLTDFYGDTDDNHNLKPGGRFRIASAMLANRPHWYLVNPDFSYDPRGVITTVMGVANVGTLNAGPLTIEYFDSSGTLISTGTVPTLLANESIRIEPGAYGYPLTQVGFGWARILGCKTNADLIGWSVREIQDLGPDYFQLEKAYGETLLGITGTEPGPGFDGPPGMTRKLKPLTRAHPFLEWPAYTTFINNSVGNIGGYTFQTLFDVLSFPCGTLGPFAGLMFSETSSTYEDGWSTGCFPVTHQSLAVDHESGEVEGIGVIGDPYMQWQIPGFADSP